MLNVEILYCHSIFKEVLWKGIYFFPLRNTLNLTHLNHKLIEMYSELSKCQKDGSSLCLFCFPYSIYFPS